MTEQTLADARLLGAQAFIPPDAFWIPRLIHEMEEPFAPIEASVGDRLDGLARGSLALAEMASHPWALARTQWSMWNLALAHFGAVHADWLDAWWRFVAPGPADPGDRTGG